MNKNYFYDLPNEIINKIFLYDSTYYIEYNRIILIINKFPKFMFCNDNNSGEYVFKKNFNNNIMVNQRLLIKAINYKKALIISSKLFFKKKIFLYNY